MEPIKTEPIKQEIINNIFENGDKLITGPILQTVLIDMIDDVNVKDQEILSKTGSWDDAATQIPNLATKAELTEAKDNLQANITNLSESVARDLTGYATEQWVESQGYLKEHQDISNLATKSELTEAKDNLQGNITSLSESVARDLANVDVDLTGYATEAWVQSQGYLTEHQDISGLATKSELNSVSESIQTDISNLATKSELTSVSESIQTDITNLSESVANSAVWKKGTGTDSIVQKLTDANEANMPTATGVGAIALGFATTASGNNSLAEGNGTNASESYSHAEGHNTTASSYGSHAEGYKTNASGYCSHAEGDSTKTSGQSSHAEGYYAIASGAWSHAEGYSTNASGNGSHAEGSSTEAKGKYSHAEGNGTNASASYSHAEGYYTETSNQYEHAQGRYNHNSENQIFSVGAGEMTPDYSVNRRNAVSILAVPNSETQVVTASFFVQNIGGYDGTNPTPGTNDLATVINNLPSGGSSETLWKKGTGKDSAVLILTGDDEANTPTATSLGAVAIGYQTEAAGGYSYAEGEHTSTSGWYSHAEGSWTNASGQASHAEGNGARAKGIYSHAEGVQTQAEGQHSHAEGHFTIALNDWEHAEGTYNHNSANQIFSIGAGEFEGGVSTRRNAISVLAVPNSDTRINTASVFVQNVGGYDGTNPLPGTNDLATVINNLPSGGGSSSGGSSETLWKKGEGTDSIVQILTGVGNETNTPTATGAGAIAVGSQTTASGILSHAEGFSTEASKDYSHAEGYETIASGYYSHAEGYYTSASGEYSHAEGNYATASGAGSHAEGEQTKASEYCSHAEGFYASATGRHSHAEGNISNASGEFSHAEGNISYAFGVASHAEGDHTEASNDYEHAQGRYNHSSTNQIFSIGTGNSSEDRRNAVSVLEVSNNNSYTSSFFIQNVGGYDGTNPTPGTNDLATVINGISSSGGTGTSTETWTFTLDNGSTVTKNIVMR